MACSRRRLFSARAVTGVVTGVLLGFCVGSLHYAVLNSHIASLPERHYAKFQIPPCLHSVRSFRFQDTYEYLGIDTPKFKQFPIVGFNSPERARRSEDDTFGQLDEDVESILEYLEEDDVGSQKLSRENRMDKIYPNEFRGLRIPQNNIDSHKNSHSQKHNNRIPKPAPMDPFREGVVEPGAPAASGFLYVGVMTAGKYIPTRGRAIMQTWGSHVPGKVELYMGEAAAPGAAEDENKLLNVVRLKNVDDNAYPPQKKSFMMLKYMYDQYLNGFEWFMRADDDVYLKPDKLELMLRKLNSSEPIFIGQTGLGNEEERGKLTLDHGENYCMGGPGMIFSREVLRRMVPNIGKCLRNMYTNHEDVEVSRCVSRFAGVKCVWSYEMKELFYEHYSKRMGYIDPRDEQFSNTLVNAISLHPNKNPIYQRKLHSHFLSEKIKTVQTKLRNLYRNVVQMDYMLRRQSQVEDFLLGINPTLTRYRSYDGNQVLPWSFFSDRLHQLPPESPRRTIPAYTQTAVKEMVLQVMRMMNGNSRIRGRLISFKRVNYGYIRVNPLFGCEYILDLLLHYNRYRGKAVSLPVRRHAYLQQTFARTEFQEDISVDLVAVLRNALKNSKPGFLQSLSDIFMPKPAKPVAAYLGLGDDAMYSYYEDSLPRRGKNFAGVGGGVYNFGETPDDVKALPNEPRANAIQINTGYALGDGNVLEPPTVNIIVPLTGRFLTFQRFMASLEESALKRNDPVSLLVMLFMPQDSKQRMEMRLTQQLVQDYNTRYPNYAIRYLPVAGQFSRGLALEVGASQYSSDSLLFFCDVDVVFSPQFIRKCRANTKPGVSVYYPILFSEFDPSLGSSPLTIQGQRKNHYQINEDAGYWRSFGYGLLCVYQSDFTSTGGFDTTIKGWGFEDVDLFGKFVHARQGQDKEDDSGPTALPMRVKEPHLVHVHHQSHCDPELSSKQLTMCLASRGSGVASVPKLYQKWAQVKANRTLHRNSEMGDPLPRHNRRIQQKRVAKDDEAYENAGGKR